MIALLRDMISILMILTAGLWGMHFFQVMPEQNNAPLTQASKNDIEVNTSDLLVASQKLQPAETLSKEIKAESKPAPPPVLSPSAQALKREILNLPPQARIKGAELRTNATLKTFYQGRDYSPLWTNKDTSPQVLFDLVRAITSSHADGLNPSHYHLSTLSQLVDAFITQPTDLERASELELLATDAYLLLAAHNYSGQITKSSFRPNWSVDRGIDLLGRMTKAVQSNTTASSLSSLLPQQPEYQFLKSQLAILEGQTVESEGPLIEHGPLLMRDMTDPRVGQAKLRLAALGFYALPEDHSPEDLYLFDHDFREAVVRFQKHVNLQEDGFIGPPDIKALNKFHSFRIQQIKANMERWRWLPNNLGERHVRVNLPNYVMKLWQDGEAVFESDVVVGTKTYATPIFSDRIEYLVFNPSWSVPPSIVRRQKVAAFKKDPGMVKRNGYVLSRNGKTVDPDTIDWSKVSRNNFPYSVWQKPGPTNAMGDVKFMFPNQHSIYLHDSSVQAFFNLSKRSHSSGCVRVKRPMELAYEIMTRDGKMSKIDIDNIVEPGGKETPVSLRRSLPIHIMYQSVIPDEEGNARFLFDIYDLDERMVRAMALNVS